MDRTSDVDDRVDDRLVTTSLPLTEFRLAWALSFLCKVQNEILFFGGGGGGGGGAGGGRVGVMRNLFGIVVNVLSLYKTPNKTCLSV